MQCTYNYICGLNILNIKNVYIYVLYIKYSKRSPENYLTRKFYKKFPFTSIDHYTNIS